MTKFVPFDSVWPKVQALVEEMDWSESAGAELWFVRDLSGRVRVLVSEETADAAFDAQGRVSDPGLRTLGEELAKRLGPRAYPPDRALLAAAGTELERLRPVAARRQIGNLTICFVDRLVTGSEWATVDELVPGTRPLRFTFFSLKGGVGRSTTVAALSAYLAQKGKRVLVLDLDLESPGISSALLDRDRRPEYGIVDWFVEDLVGQGDLVLDKMVGRPDWPQALPGDVLVVPAHGSEVGDYVAKLGRVYLDDPSAAAQRTWTKRLASLLSILEEKHQPDFVFLDSRSGLHDLAAAAVTDVAAHVMLFAVDSDSTWDGYRALFSHWRWYDVVRRIRERLSLVAALVPTDRREREYLLQLRERAWDIFRENLYDEVPADYPEELEQDLFSFSLNDDGAPHDPTPIYWNEGLQALPTLRALPESAVQLAYNAFFDQFEMLVLSLRGT